MSDNLVELMRDEDQARKPRMTHPDGYTPGLDTEKGTFVVRSDRQLDTSAIGGDFADQLRTAGMDPADWLLEDDRIEVRTWDANVGGGRVEKFFYFKARILRRSKGVVDVDDLLRRVKRLKPLKRLPPGGNWTYVVCLSDWQIGKRDGDGTAGIIDRITAGVAEVKADVTQARKEGYEIGRLLIAGIGDIIDGCDGFYPMQTFEVELDRRQQTRVARRLVYHVIQELAPLAETVTVLAVPGNHGENRKNGKAFTSFGDNDDVAIFEQVAEILQANPERYRHVNFLIPDGDLSITVDVGGTVIGFTHGHISRSSGTAGLAHTKVWNWWKAQAHGRSFIGDADVLVNGHFHYFNMCENGARTHIQVPALDHSTWFEAGSGYSTRHGMVSFLSGPEPVERLRIHRCRVEGEV